MRKTTPKRWISLLTAVFMFVSSFAPVNLGALLPELQAAEAVSGRLTHIKACHITEEMLNKAVFYEECDDSDFKKLHKVQKPYGITAYALEETITDTGLFKSSLTGLELEIYQALERVNLTCQNNGMSFTYPATGSDLEGAVTKIKGAYKEALYAYEYDHLEKLYWQLNNGIGLAYEGETDAGYSFRLYYKTVENSQVAGYTEALEAQAKARVSAAVASISAHPGIYDKLYYANQWVCENCEYDYLNAPKGSREEYYAHSMMGLLIDGRGVCETYAKTFKILCQRMNLPCIVVISDNHAFNYVKVDGNWYMVDCTWNDGIGSHTMYFLCSNSPYIDRDSHVPVGPLSYPNTSKTNYEKTSHNWDAGRVTEKAGCESSGTMTFYCTDPGCQASKTEIIEGIGHKFVFESTTSTCTVYGIDTYRCVYCDETETKTSKSLLNHKYSSVNIYVFNDDYTACDIYRTCDTCGREFDLGDGTVMVVSDQKASCTTDGQRQLKIAYTIHTGNVTSTGTTTKYETSPALGHAYEETERRLPANGNDGYVKSTCMRCGDVMTESLRCKDQTITVTKEKATSPLTKATFNVGKTLQLAVSGAMTKVEYLSSDSKIATVSSTGLIKGVKPGLVDITVKAKGDSIYRSSNTVTIKIDVRPGITTSLKASNVSAGVKLTWEKVANVKGYDIYCNDVKIGSASASAVTYTDKTKRTNGTKLSYKVVAYAVNGASTEGKKVTTYCVLGPVISTLKNTAAKTLTVNYSKVAGNTKITGYQVQYSTSSSFASPKTVTVSKNSTLKATIKSLTKGKIYYVRVRSYKKVTAGNFYSCWSAKKSLKITK
ncbi:MAG: fibronectin type III domain-containing protein [Dorea sp.]|nr:fibronectin type III domain-containing protein [Dorea sp.]